MTTLKQTDLRAYDECPRALHHPQRPPRAAVSKWQHDFVEGLVLVLIIAAVFLFGRDIEARITNNMPQVTRLYEDGSGELSDGRSFCIAGELCDRRAP